MNSVDRNQNLERLREELKRLKLDAFLVPVADAYQSSWLSEHDQRLQWLTGFTGSAGLGIVGTGRSAIFVDGRYTIQAPQQVDSKNFEILEYNKANVLQWLGTLVAPDHEAKFYLGVDPWLHSDQEIEEIKSGLQDWRIVAVEANPIDQYWHQQPPPPSSHLFEHSQKYAGQSRDEKIKMMQDFMATCEIDAMVATQSDNIAWLLNIRGRDIQHTPIKQAFAIIRRDGAVTIYTHMNRHQGEVEWLGHQVNVRPSEAFNPALESLKGQVFVADTASHAVVKKLKTRSEVKLCRGSDPCDLAKAQKNPTQIAGIIEAHDRDGVAMIEFLTWFDETAPSGRVDEIAAADQLQYYRQQTGCLHDVSFDTISASGPHGAIIHYRVTKQTNRPLSQGELYLVDSGGQYLDGTTDVTRTLTVGRPSTQHQRSYTLVLRCLIALASLRWPQGTTGGELDVIARQHLWREEMDFSHGTGHGVGQFLGVHEGSFNISPKNAKSIKEGMVLSIEPGYYAKDDYGIRLENLAVVETCPHQEKKTSPFLRFKTLTQVPFEQRLIDISMLSEDEKAWLDRYHSGVWRRLHERCSDEARQWLKLACQPLN